jgi:hypothetical protein
MRIFSTALQSAFFSMPYYVTALSFSPRFRHCQPGYAFQPRRFADAAMNAIFFAAFLRRLFFRFAAAADFFAVHAIDISFSRHFYTSTPARRHAAITDSHCAAPAAAFISPG